MMRHLPGYNLLQPGYIGFENQVEDVENPWNEIVAKDLVMTQI